MNLEKICNKIKYVNNDLHNLLLEEVVRDLEEEIKMKLTTTSGKARLNKCLSYAKKMFEKKPVLGYVKTLGDKQLYTDGYFLVSLCKDDYTTIDEVPNKFIYPVSVSDYLNDRNYDFEFEVNVRDLMFKLKDKEKKFISLSHQSVIYGLEVNNLKNFITFMNYKTDDIIKFRYKNRCFITEKENGTRGLIMEYVIKEVNGFEVDYKEV